MPVGKKLAAERRSQGKTLHDIVDTTKIMGRRIEALENERWDELPAPPYVKGYIQNYAKVLSLDPKPLLEEYAQDIGTPRSPEDNAALEHIPERTVVPHRRDMHAIPTKAVVTVGVALVVVILLLWGIAALAGRDDTPLPIAPETTATPGVSSGVATSTGVPGESTATAPEGSFQLAVAITPGESSWVRVLVDGLLAYEGTMPGGESKEWTVGTSAVVRAGKPSAVTVMRDGAPVEMPDTGDEIAELTLSASE